MESDAAGEDILNLESHSIERGKSRVCEKNKEKIQRAGVGRGLEGSEAEKERHREHREWVHCAGTWGGSQRM